jgi:polyisoprenoid-binding protein YceI
MNMGRIGLFFLFAFAVNPALAAEWVIDSAQSYIAFSGSHAGKAFEGRFERFGGEIDFDPQAVDTSRARIVIDLTSAKMGDAMYDKTLPQADWLNAAVKPEAVFETKTFTEKGGGLYQVDGVLHLREAVVPVSLETKIIVTGNKAEATGKTTLKRLDYAIGRSSDAAGEWVSLDIPVEIHIFAKIK